MRKWLLALCISINVFINSNAYCEHTCQSRPVTIGIIDSGLGFAGNGIDAKLCAVGHKDFTDTNGYFPGTRAKNPVPIDSNGHGTNVAGIIQNYADKGNGNYCLVILKYWDGYGSHDNEADTIRAIHWATALHLDFINYSSGGPLPNEDEYRAIEVYVNNGGTFVVAAGNEGLDLDKPLNGYYPAKYAKYDKRIIVVGMLDNYGVQSRQSNYGSMVSRWEIGQDVVGYSLVRSGTSQAAAVATGKLVSKTNGCK